LNAHKKVAQEAWLAVFRSELTKEQRKMVLGMMTSLVAPWFNKPELLMDFLVDSYNSGGSTSLLALSGVFYLIQERNLDYPDFYKKLYSLLDSGLLHSKHRSKFFRLLDTFMSSTHLPAVLVASFIKRLSRLALNAPPAGIVAIVPWIYNMLRRHPTCTFMIHREVRTEEEKEQLEQEGMDDPFNPDEEDPMETNAIDSCLWELVTLQSHYHPNVATIAKIISEQFTKQQYNLEDFLDHSYGSVSHIPPGFWSAVTNT
jgi:U3 small nucleolar RNA-associated protein 19